MTSWLTEKAEEEKVCCKNTVDTKEESPILLAASSEGSTEKVRDTNRALNEMGIYIHGRLTGCGGTGCAGQREQPDKGTWHETAHHDREHMGPLLGWSLPFSVSLSLKWGCCTYIVREACDWLICYHTPQRPEQGLVYSRHSTNRCKEREGRKAGGREVRREGMRRRERRTKGRTQMNE